MITVDDARAKAAKWVAANLAGRPGFRGALLHGSVCHLGIDARLPAESDVDVVSLWDGPPPLLGKTRFDELVLDVCGVAADTVSDPERVLANHVFAPSFARGLLVVETDAMLPAVAAAVAERFADPRWIRARVEDTLSGSARILGHFAADPCGTDAEAGLLFGPGVLVHAILVAACRNPTVRRRYEAAGELLAELGMADEHEKLLDLLGSRGLSREACESHFAAMRAAYDEAIEVPDAPKRYANHVSAEGRKSAIDGTARSFAEGRHREAMFFVGTCFSKALAILGPVTSPERLAEHSTRFGAFLADVGIAAAEERVRRVDAARRAIPWIRELAERIMIRTRP